MVAQGDTVVPHGINHIYLKVTFKNREIGGTLTEVPGMEHEDILLSISLDYTVAVSRAFYDTPVTSILAGTFRFHVAVSVIEMNDCQSFLSVRTGQEQHGTSYS